MAYLVREPERKVRGLVSDRSRLVGLAMGKFMYVGRVWQMKYLVLLTAASV